MLPDIGWGELLVIAGIILLLFGPKRLPDLAQSLGKSIRLFKQGLKEGFAEEKPKDDESSKKTTPTA
jgi:sec-independent protein translocase protein TatA